MMMSLGRHTGPTSNPVAAVRRAGRSNNPVELGLAQAYAPADIHIFTDLLTVCLKHKYTQAYWAFQHYLQFATGLVARRANPLAETRAVLFLEHIW